MRTFLRTLLALLGSGILACGGGPDARFPVRDPIVRDGDLASVRVACRLRPTPQDEHHVSCAPEPSSSQEYWDFGDAALFRPLSDTTGVVVGAEAVDVNALDEVPDSAWFTNRIDQLDPAELRRGACSPPQLLDDEHVADGAWIVDKGKDGGSTFGFRIKVPGQGKYLIKTEPKQQPERVSAASVIGAAVMHAAGFYAPCEQVLWVRPTVFTPQAGLLTRMGFESPVPLDRQALDRVFAESPHRGDRVRMGASAWLPGYILGTTRSEGTRADDPNDVVPHEDRRELRGMRLLAAWLGRFDAREANTLDTWIADDPRVPDSSPGRVIHYQMDTSETLGAMWQWDSLARRLGHGYVIDYGDTMADFITLGMRTHPWDDAKPVPGRELFGYFDVAHFSPEQWRSELPNPAFTRMTERDGAWMARILARFTWKMIQVLAEMASFTDPGNATYLAEVLHGRLHRILERYLTKLSPIAKVRVEGDWLCGVDLAEARALRPMEQFRYHATVEGTEPALELAVERKPGGGLCVKLPRRPSLRVVLRDGVAPGPLVAHVADAGAKGLVLVGLERPMP